MISDDQLYTLSIFLGSLAMMLIVIYHFLEVNSTEENDDKTGDKTVEVRTGILGEKITLKS